jgi:hypothetical protein
LPVIRCLLEDRVLGAGPFARRQLGDDVLKALGSVADSIALGIERKRAQTRWPKAKRASAWLSRPARSSLASLR